MPRLVVIVNGAAGGGRGSSRLEPHLAALRASGEVVLRPTDGPGHATALARAAVADGADGVVAVGGDGTLFEVVNGLLPAGGPALGVIPVGTGNSFVRDVGHRDPAAAAAAIASGRTRPIDALRLRHDAGETFSVNLVSFGFSAEAGALTNARYKPLGVAGYVLAVLQTLVGLHPHVAPHALDGGAFDGRPFTLLSFCNTRYTGGDMQMAPGADPADGRLDVVRIGPMGRRRFLSSFPRIFRGTHPQMPEVSLATAASVAFAPGAPVDVMIDGEVLTLVPRALDVLPGALRVFE